MFINEQRYGQMIIVFVFTKRGIFENFMDERLLNYSVQLTKKIFLLNFIV